MVEIKQTSGIPLKTGDSGQSVEGLNAKAVTVRSKCGAR
jgi:hypothetical protein